MFAGLTVILGAVYMLRSYKSIMLGDKKVSDEQFTPLVTSEKAVLIIVCAVVILTGIFSQPLLEISEPAVKEILNGVMK
jgi:NADH-quinone oxidoreductase subunit M